jgi:hypothetical protein
MHPTPSLKKKHPATKNNNLILTTSFTDARTTPPCSQQLRHETAALATMHHLERKLDDYTKDSTQAAG